MMKGIKEGWKLNNTRVCIRQDHVFLKEKTCNSRTNFFLFRPPQAVRIPAIHFTFTAIAFTLAWQRQESLFEAECGLILPPFAIVCDQHRHLLLGFCEFDGRRIYNYFYKCIDL